jgi:processive 1,2-diacylglycerol beta-glucosyltransferase
LNITIKTILRKDAPRPAANARPAMLLSIANGAGHTRAAQAIAQALEARASTETQRSFAKPRIVEVNDFMTPIARFTHVTAYLWLVKNAPHVWARIDRYQKAQTQTSPEWFWRRHCRKLFDLARELNPSAFVATEVGCCEIAALIKRDLHLRAPLVFVATDHDVDRACIQPEVDLYCVANESSRRTLIENGAHPLRIKVWGVPVAADVAALAKKFDRRRALRNRICDELKFDARKPLVLASGGGEGGGKLTEAAARILRNNHALQLIVLTGRNAKLAAKLEKLRQSDETARARLRVLGWTKNVADLLGAADLLVSQLGVTFDEALAAELPIVALPPQPGSEWIKYRLLEEWGVGRAVQTIDEMSATVDALLRDEESLAAMRANARRRRKVDAAENIARWILDETTSFRRNASETSDFDASEIDISGALASVGVQSSVNAASGNG